MTAPDTLKPHVRKAEYLPLRHTYNLTSKQLAEALQDYLRKHGRPLGDKFWFSVQDDHKARGEHSGVTVCVEIGGME